MSRVLLVVLTILLLSACAPQPPATATPSPTPEVEEEIVTSTPTPTSMPQPSVTVTPTLSPEEPSLEKYEDNWLCFTVEVPAGWTVDGVPGGFASFTPGTGQLSFNIANVAFAKNPTLEQALDELKRGTLGPYIQEVKDFVVDSQPALWVTFAPGTQFQFVVLVIAPDCGDGPHALFISATGAEQGSFETFLNHIRFIQGGATYRRHVGNLV